MKIHPLLAKFLCGIDSRWLDIGAKEEWIKAGRPLVEEEPGPDLNWPDRGFTGLMRYRTTNGEMVYTPAYGDYLVDKLAVKDAKIAELSRDLVRAHRHELGVPGMNICPDCWNAALRAVMEKVVGIVGSESDRIWALRKP